MELCNKKSDDRIWMDEVAAMQAFSPEFSYLGTSGIIIAGEGNDGALSSRQPNGQVDAPASDSTTSPGSLETNPGKVDSPFSLLLRKESNFWGQNQL